MAENNVTTDGNVFDSVFRTLVEKAPETVIPLINEAFGRDYPEDEPFEQYRNEHETPRRRIATDSFFRIRGNCYHVECQSTHDSAMAIRMIEYDFAIAVEESLRSGAPYRMRLPESCVLYLRSAPVPGGKLRLHVDLPNGVGFDYEARAVFAQEYGMGEIFSKRLLALVPFFIMRHEDDIASIADDAEARSGFLHECSDLRAQLEDATIGEGKPDLYERIVELVVHVSDHLLARHGELRKEARRAMGGEVLELMCDRIAAAEKKARERGLAEGRAAGLAAGRAEGLAEGRAEGRDEGRAEERKILAERLRALGVNEETLRRALSGDSPNRRA